MKDDNYLKFPTLIREKIETGEFVFPEETAFEYNQFLAYRGIEREKEDCSEITKKDFLSHAERGIRRRSIDTKSPTYYSASLNLSREAVENSLQFPRKGWKMAVGFVYQEAGPAYINKNTGHVDWWLYENAKIEGFSIC